MSDVFGPGWPGVGASWLAFKVGLVIWSRPPEVEVSGDLGETRAGLKSGATEWQPKA